MVRKFKLAREDERWCVLIDEIEFVQLARVCKTRNTSLYEKLKSHYEKLLDEKFPE
jgi:hypothetical protein